MIITCLVCNKEGTYKDVGNPPAGNGWRLASNRIGGYTCGPECDAVIEAYDEAKKSEAKAAKAAKKKERTRVDS